MRSRSDDDTYLRNHLQFNANGTGRFHFKGMIVELRTRIVRDLPNRRTSIGRAELHCLNVIKTNACRGFNIRRDREISVESALT